MPDERIKLDLVHESEYSNSSMPEVWRIYAQLEIELGLFDAEKPLCIQQALVDTGSPYTVIAAHDWSTSGFVDIVRKGKFAQTELAIGGAQRHYFIVPASLRVYESAAHSQGSPELEAKLLLEDPDYALQASLPSFKTIIGMDVLGATRFTYDALCSPATAYVEFSPYTNEMAESLLQY